MTWQRNQTGRHAVIEVASQSIDQTDQPKTLRYSHGMIRNKTLHAAARLLLGAFIAAYAMSSVHVYAGVAKAGGSPPAPAAHHAMPPAPQSGAAQHQEHGAIPDADRENADNHCQPKVVDPAIMLCKFHCQNAVQTLDHPSATLPDLQPVAALMVPLADTALARKPLVVKAFRPEAAHHGGAPPPYASTARLRI